MRGCGPTMKIYFDDGKPVTADGTSIATIGEAMRMYFNADPPAYPAVDDLAPTPAPAAARPARRQRRGLRNWQKFAMCYAPIMAGGALILWDPATAAVGLAIWLTTMLIIFVLANRAGRL